MERFTRRIILTLFLAFIFILSGIVLNLNTIGTDSHFKIIEFSEIDFGDFIVFDEMTTLSPDDRSWVVVKAKDQGLRQSHISIINRITDTAIRLEETKDYKYFSTPVWNNDGTKLAYFKFYPYEIKTIDIESGEIETVYSEGSEKPTKLSPSIGYGGKTYLRWTDNETLEFENNNEIPSRIESININVEEIVAKEISDTNSEILSETLESENDFNIEVPYFSQRDPMWQEEKLGSCDETLGSAGCAIAAIAMNFKHLGIETITPEILNTFLSENNNQGYLNGCDVMWFLAPNFNKGIKLKGVYFNSYNTDRVDYELSLGNPVIVGFDQVNFTPIPHWIVITGKDENGEYLTNDPWTGEQKLTSYFGTRFDHIIVYTSDNI